MNALFRDADDSSDHVVSPPMESLSDASWMGLALDGRRSERIDAVLDDPEVDQTAARIVGSTSALVVPLLDGANGLGGVAAWDKQGGDPRFTDADVTLAGLRMTLSAARRTRSLEAYDEATQVALEQIDTEVTTLPLLIADLRAPGARRARVGSRHVGRRILLRRAHGLAEHLALNIQLDIWLGP